MTEPRHPPDDPREWLNRARSNLRLAAQLEPGIYLEELCFNAHQAAEKAIKGVFIFLRAEFPYTHDLRELLDLLGHRFDVPERVRQAQELTPFASRFRYPGHGKATTEEQYRQALAIADAVIGWAAQVIAKAGQ